jgi:hypothetical protein
VSDWGGSTRTFDASWLSVNAAVKSSLTCAGANESVTSRFAAYYGIRKATRKHFNGVLGGRYALCSGKYWNVKVNISTGSAKPFTQSGEGH